MAWRVSMVLWLALAAPGCAAQLGTAHSLVPGPDDFRLALVAGARALPARRNGPYVGADVEVTFHHRPELGLVTGSLGYRFLAPPFGFELGGNLGLGEPDRAPWAGTGFYAGAQGAVLFRLSGEHDREMGYAPLALLVDLVLQPRVGFWAPSFRDRSDPWVDAGVSLAVRFSGISDIADTSNREWEQP